MQPIWTDGWLTEYSIRQIWIWIPWMYYGSVGKRACKRVHDKLSCTQNYTIGASLLGIRISIPKLNIPLVWPVYCWSVTTEYLDILAYYLAPFTRAEWRIAWLPGDWDGDNQWLACAQWTVQLLASNCWRDQRACIARCRCDAYIRSGISFRRHLEGRYLV